MRNSHDLAPLFEPIAVAIIGATERDGAVGGVLIQSMRAAAYQGALYAVNPKYRSARDVACYSSVVYLPQAVE